MIAGQRAQEQARLISPYRRFEAPSRRPGIALEGPEQAAMVDEPGQCARSFSVVVNGENPHLGSVVSHRHDLAGRRSLTRGPESPD